MTKLDDVLGFICDQCKQNRHDQCAGGLCLCPCPAPKPQEDLFEVGRKPRPEPVLGNQHHEAVDEVLDVPRLTTQFGKILTCLSDREWHDLYSVARELDVPHGSVGSQIRNARVAGWVIEKRRRDVEGGTWEYRLLGKKKG